MKDVQLAIKYLENMVNSQYWRLIEGIDDFREIGESILILTKELKKQKGTIQVVCNGRNNGKINSILKEYISKGE